MGVGPAGGVSRYAYHCMYLKIPVLRYRIYICKYNVHNIEITQLHDYTVRVNFRGILIFVDFVGQWQ